MSLSDIDRVSVVRYRVEKAAAAMEQVKYNLPMGYWDLLANRMYYAAYYAASALLIANGFYAKTHETIIRSFGEHFVMTGVVSRDLGRFYNRLFTLRLKGDYDDKYNLTESDVLPLVEPTEEFIRIVSALALKDTSKI